ncbi:fatty-acyl-CoA synthase [Desulfatibacillum alkenivorans DSM 16219]|jgi:fatty-acyl-CoA synthase|uniref:Fatty-acyl-CoA synthase n=1 Tax=Desulfatibacillum alkenivorans DSM 16219 TaxID=1121393 RepID=A0A1M6DX34_9BACT|nr:acyl-CoA synthetase [Desulfatibacillum alkenivorans]SHI77762.1 fatty-acyl-CoA synthase [Desulfatibacillum alkenivorans DSM 16219]
MQEIRIASVADVEELEKVPFEQRLKAKNTYEMLKLGAEVDPNAPAMSFMLSGETYNSPMTVNYAEFWRKINQTANMFHDLGIGPTDVITYLLPNLPHTHYILWGGEAAGVVNPINPMLEAHTIADICEAAGTKVLVALGEVPGSDIWEKAEMVREKVSGIQKIVRVFGAGDEANNIVGFDEVIENYNGDSLDSGREIQPQDIASLFHTGGTTGTPKLAPHTHYNEVAMATMMTMSGIMKSSDTLLCGLPLFHVNGVMVTGGAPFSIGAHVVLLSPQGYRDPGVLMNFFKIVEFYKAAFFSCVPTVLSVLLDIPTGDADISSLQFALCGAAPLSVELIQRFEAHTKMKVLEGYGLTEGTTASCVNPPEGEQRVGSIGIRLPYQEMKIMIPTSTGAKEAAPNEIGAVCIKGPNVFTGYLDQTKNTDIWMKEGWFNTGDLGRQDEDGYFWLTGRQKDLIIRGGHNIDPAAIEEPLYRLMGVQVAAAVGRPDAHAGEVPVAFVQLQQGSELTKEEIEAHLQKEIGERAAIPKEVYILEEIPLTPVGKIFKPSLRHEAVRLAYLDEVQKIENMFESVDVTVNEDKVHGTKALIKVKPMAGVTEDQAWKAVNDALARFTVRYDIQTE